VTEPHRLAVTQNRLMETATPPRAWRSLLAPAGVAAATVVAVGVLASVDPNEPGHYPTCPLLATTGLWCPGCGSLRAVHALAGGDVPTALQRNPFTVLAVPFLVWAWLRWAGSSWGWLPPRRSAAPAWAVWTLLVAVLGFWVLRNVPGLTWLSPA
jgi:hypothetical protein